MKFFLTLILLFTAYKKPAELSAFPFQEKQSWIGTASFYHQKFEGRKTSSGEAFTNKDYTAAHKSLPFGTLVKVMHLKNGREVIVKINDRLPPGSSRLIDLSQAAAGELDMLRAGLAKVKLSLIEVEEIPSLDD
jgi:rare lipoprotein A